MAHFLGEHAGARAAHIANLETHGFSLSSFRPAAACFGPLWAASRGLWTPFWIATAVEAACLTGLVRSRWSGGSPETPEAHTVLFAASIAVVLIVALSWRAAGWRVGLFSAVALAYLGLFGYWEKSMSTLALVMASALLCIVIGTPIGIWCGKDAKVYAVVKPVLDFMQTMPSFVYLIPAVAFFSIGKPPGVFATVIFAMPPMIRLAALGIQQVPHDVREAALAFGTSPWKLLVKVELPLSAPSMLAGMNQTIMMSLSMVIIASMIGAGGLGYDVLIALRRLNTGEGMLAGTAIVVCAMILDRIIQGRRSRRGSGPKR